MIELHTIEELVDKNHTSAYVLDCYGIDFRNYLTKTLFEVCHQHHLNTENVSHNIAASWSSKGIEPDKFERESVEVIINYLKHSHHIFVKKSLPYMDKLISNLIPGDCLQPELIHDLKIVFPLFREDFIHHIYDEEDNLFYYLDQLSKVSRGNIHPNKIYALMEKISLDDLAHHHEDADDEMRGIRMLTGNYTRGIESDLLLRTIYRELQQFESDLILHADLENKVLFPKSIELENQVKSHLLKIRSLN